ncbi:MAG: cytochrome P450 [Nannocystales bacterium]
MTELPPGPRAPKIVQALSFGRDPTRYLLQCAAAYGDMFTLRMPNDPPRVVLSNPVAVKKVFSLRPDAYRSDNLAIHLNLGSRSILFRDGEQHKQLRRLTAPSLQAKQVRGYADAMLEVTRETVARWPTDTAFPLLPEMNRIALDVVLRCVFGVEGSERDALRVQVLTWLQGTLSPALFVTGMVVNAYRLRRVLDRAVDRARTRLGRRPLLFRGLADAKVGILAALQQRIEHCRHAPAGAHNNVLSLLVGARYEDGSPLDDEDILDQLVTFLVGGHETTANTLAWALSMIVRRPAVLARVQAELYDHFGDGDIDASRAGELSYLDACLKESMRLSPISPGPIRTLTQECQLPGYRLSPGTAVWASTYLTHRRADVWKNSDRFNPERFLEGAGPGAHEFFPFGGGARRCLGALFAEFEMRIVLAEILHRFELLPCADPPQAVFAGISMSPADGVPVRTRRRDVAKPDA